MKTLRIIFIIPILFIGCSTIETDFNFDNNGSKSDMNKEISDSSLDPIQSPSNSNECNYDTVKLNFSFEKEIKKVQIVSYIAHDRTFSLKKEELGNIKFDTTQIDKFGLEDLVEITELNENQIDSLKEIIKSYDSDDFYLGSDCFNPRHTIFFIDKDNYVIAYMRLCLECQNERSSHKELRITCKNQIEELRSLFIKSGITFGI